MICSLATEIMIFYSEQTKMNYQLSGRLSCNFLVGGENMFVLCSLLFFRLRYYLVKISS